MENRIYIEMGKFFPRIFMTAKQLSEYEGKTPTHYRHIIHEIECQVKRGRYPDSCIGDDGEMSVNYFVFRDYLANRKALKDKNLCKHVKPFNPAEIASICPIVKEVVVMDK